MKKMHVMLLLVGVLLASIVSLGWWLHSAEPALATNISAEKSPVLAPNNNATLERLPEADAPVPLMPGTDSALVEVPALTQDATQSMSHAREHGDARQPALLRDAPREAPTVQELADPEAYQRYEVRQSQRLHKAYVAAADAEIPRLQQDIQRARAEGLSAEQIAEGEEKLRRIQAMRDQLQAESAVMP